MSSGDPHQTTTNIDIERGLQLPVYISTDPANAHCRPAHFPEHRAEAAIPFRSQQVEAADAAYELVARTTKGFGAGEGIPIIAYSPKNQDCSRRCSSARGHAPHAHPRYALWTAEPLQR